MSDSDTTPEPSAAPDAASKDEPKNMAEAEAIAAAIMIGEKMRREQKSGAYFYARRLGLFGAGLCFAGLMILFTYTRLKRDFSPTIPMILLTLGLFAGGAVWYWAYSRTHRDE